MELVIKIDNWKQFEEIMLEKISELHVWGNKYTELIDIREQAREAYLVAEPVKIVL